MAVDYKIKVFSTKLSSILQCQLLSDHVTNSHTNKGKNCPFTAREVTVFKTHEAVKLMVRSKLHRMPIEILSFSALLAVPFTITVHLLKSYLGSWAE